jgi:preprotein translocase subunit SecF
MKVFANANYKFLENRKRAYIATAIALVIGVGAMIANVASLGSWLNYGVDFTGGALVQVRFVDAVEAGQVRGVVPEATEVTSFGGANEYVIRTPLTEGDDVDAVRLSVQERLQAEFGADKVEIVRTELVGPKIGAELQTKALLAILISFALTLIYLAFRFEWRFGVAAVIATGHDILITLGILAVFRVDVSVQTVAALLTILGYSLNDTIVVFDRIREELAQKGARKVDRVALLNRAINETLPRTALTGASVLGVLLALTVLGPPTIRTFCLVMLIGVGVGTFSSIFVASPALYEIQKRWGTGEEAKAKKRRPEPAAV